MENIKATPWEGDPGIICMPMIKNIPEGKPEWEKIKCECGQEAWLRPEAKQILAEVPGMQAKCTECALKFRKEQINPKIKVEIKEAALTLLPPHPSKCQECAVDHKPNEPHNPQSMYYQFKFNMQHGRKATWMDAMAHCSDEIKKIVLEILAEKGIDPTQ